MKNFKANLERVAKSERRFFAFMGIGLKSYD